MYPFSVFGSVNGFRNIPWGKGSKGRSIVREGSMLDAAEGGCKGLNGGGTKSRKKSVRQEMLFLFQYSLFFFILNSRIPNLCWPRKIIRIDCIDMLSANKKIMEWINLNTNVSFIWNSIFNICSLADYDLHNFAASLQLTTGHCRKTQLRERW